MNLLVEGGFDFSDSTSTYIGTCAKCDTAIIAGWLQIGEIAKTDAKYLPHGRAHLFPLSQLKDIKTLIGLDSTS
jgi:hypothetical protein